MDPIIYDEEYLRNNPELSGAPMQVAANYGEPDQRSRVNDYVANKYNIANYNPETRAELIANVANSGNTGAAALAGFGAGLRGGNVSSAFDSAIESGKAAPKAQLMAFDTGKAQALKDQEAKRKITLESSEDDPNSIESKTYQDLAASFGANPEIVKGASAKKLKSVLPLLQKKYEIRQKSLDRSAMNEDKKAMAAEKAANEGFRAVDRDYAKDFNEWTSSGKAALEKNINALSTSINELKNDSSLSGGLTGALPDRLTNDKVLAQRARVGGAIQNALKATLGSQFTEKEGERVLKNTYNEAASPATNSANLEALIKQLRAQAANNDAKSSYFQNSGTLKGFKEPSKPKSMSDLSDEELDARIKALGG